VPQVLAKPTIVPAAGEPPKEIAEFVGGASTGDDAVSVARMRTQGGWVEPGQVAQFDEVTYVRVSARRARRLSSGSARARRCLRAAMGAFDAGPPVPRDLHPRIRDPASSATPAEGRISLTGQEDALAGA
jgi:hypothetical protein